MGPGLVSFLFTVGASTWLYTKFQRYSGNNTRRSLVAAGFAAILIFIFFYSLLTFIL